MTIIEAMCTAAWEHDPTNGPFSNLSQRSMDRVMASMRAALLALAECELSESVKQAGDDPLDAKSAFQAMIRAIAEDKSND